MPGSRINGDTAFRAAGRDVGTHAGGDVPYVRKNRSRRLGADGGGECDEEQSAWCEIPPEKTIEPVRGVIRFHNDGRVMNRETFKRRMSAGGFGIC